MAITLKTTVAKESSGSVNSIESCLGLLGREIRAQYHQIRDLANKCTSIKCLMDIVNHHSEVGIESLPCIESLKQEARLSDNPSVREVYVGAEGVLEDYAKKVATFAQSMVSTFRKYNTGLFDLVIKKLRVNKAIDTSKFVQIDTSMRLVVMKYEDYTELGEGAGTHSADMASEISGWFGYLNTIKKNLEDGKADDARAKLGEFVKSVNSSLLVTYLKDHKLVDFIVDSVGEQTDGSGGLVKASPSKRFGELEQSYLLSEAGWTDVDKIKNAYVLKHAEEVSNNISKLYKTAIDFMDEARRISGDSCVEEPYICVSLIKYASLIAQMINIYVKTYDVCWTTCLRVCQACMVEQK